MKKLLLALLLILPVIGHAQQFTLGPVFMQEKNITLEQQRNIIAWEAQAMMFQKEIFGKYSMRWWDDKVKMQNIYLGYSLNNFKPFASLDVYEDKYKIGGGATILMMNTNSFFSLTGRGFESGYGFNASLGFLKGGNIFDLSYDLTKYSDTTLSGAKLQFGFLF